MSAALIRGAAFFLPLGSVLVAMAVQPPSDRRVAAAIVGTAWNVLTLSFHNAVAISAGWWRFNAEGAVLAGVPVDLLLGWALLWGGIPAVIRAPAPLLIGVLGMIDLALMPLAESMGQLVRLGPSWLTGEVVGILVCLIPGLLLARWTRDDRFLAARVTGQVIIAGGLFVILPIALTGVWSRPLWQLGLLGQVMAIPILLGVAAAREFAIRGYGTPLPYDPPRRLVTGGPYAYVRNPMQLAMALTFLLLSPLDLRFLAATAVAVAYGAGLAAWHEGERLTARFGAEWRAYRRAVRPWLPPLASRRRHAQCDRPRRWRLRIVHRGGGVAAAAPTPPADDRPGHPGHDQDHVRRRRRAARLRRGRAGQSPGTDQPGLGAAGLAADDPGDLAPRSALCGHIRGPARGGRSDGFDRMKP